MRATPLQLPGCSHPAPSGAGPQEALAAAQPGWMRRVTGWSRSCRQLAPPPAHGEWHAQACDHMPGHIWVRDQRQACTGVSLLPSRRPDSHVRVKQSDEGTQRQAPHLGRSGGSCLLPAAEQALGLKREEQQLQCCLGYWHGLRVRVRVRAAWYSRTWAWALSSTCVRTCRAWLRRPLLTSRSVGTKLIGSPQSRSTSAASGRLCRMLAARLGSCRAMLGCSSTASAGRDICVRACERASARVCAPANRRAQNCQDLGCLRHRRPTHHAHHCCGSAQRRMVGHGHQLCPPLREQRQEALDGGGQRSVTGGQQQPQRLWAGPGGGACACTMRRCGPLTGIRAPAATLLPQTAWILPWPAPHAPMKGPRGSISCIGGVPPCRPLPALPLARAA